MIRRKENKATGHDSTPPEDKFRIWPLAYLPKAAPGTGYQTSPHRALHPATGLAARTPSPSVHPVTVTHCAGRLTRRPSPCAADFRTRDSFASAPSQVKAHVRTWSRTTMVIEQELEHRGWTDGRTVSRSDEVAANGFWRRVQSVAAFVPRSGEESANTAKNKNTSARDEERSPGMSERDVGLSSHPLLSLSPEIPVGPASLRRNYALLKERRRGTETRMSNKSLRSHPPLTYSERWSDRPSVVQLAIKSSVHRSDSFLEVSGQDGTRTHSQMHGR